MRTSTQLALQAALNNEGAYIEIKEILEFTEGPGSRFYVNSVAGSDNFEGSKNAPLATINAAIAKCTANRGDLIIVAPGHVEDLGSTDTIDFDIAGVTCIGQGNGPDRPRIDFNHANGAIDIGANGVTLRNFTLRPSVATVSVGIDVEAAVTDTLLKDIEFLPGEAADGTDEFVVGIDIKAGCTRTYIHGIRYAHHASCNGSNSAVKLTGASDLCEIKDFVIHIVGAGAIAGINGDTTLSTRLLIENGVIFTDAEPGIELLTGTTGVIRDVEIFSNLATIDACTIADGMAHFDVEYCEVGNEAGTIVKTPSLDD